MAVATHRLDIAAADIAHPDPAVAVAIVAAVTAAVDIAVVAVEEVTVVEEVIAVEAPPVAAPLTLPEENRPATPYPDRFSDVP